MFASMCVFVNEVLLWTLGSVYIVCHPSCLYRRQPNNNAVLRKNTPTSVCPYIADGHHCSSRRPSSSSCTAALRRRINRDCLGFSRSPSDSSLAFSFDFLFLFFAIEREEAAGPPASASACARLLGAPDVFLSSVRKFVSLAVTERVRNSPMIGSVTISAPRSPSVSALQA